MHNQNNRKMGSIYEEIACAYLEKQGLKIVEKNYRIRQGEIDIIAKDHKTLVFVEVKFRKNLKSGYPQEAVDKAKQKQICKVAMFYLSSHNLLFDTSCRFDVLSILNEKIIWNQNAFDFCGRI